MFGSEFEIGVRVSQVIIAETGRSLRFSGSWSSGIQIERDGGSDMYLPERVPLKPGT